MSNLPGLTLNDIPGFDRESRSSCLALAARFEARAVAFEVASSRLGSQLDAMTQQAWANRLRCMAAGATKP